MKELDRSTVDRIKSDFLKYTDGYTPDEVGQKWFDEFVCERWFDYPRATKSDVVRVLDTWASEEGAAKTNPKGISTAEVLAERREQTPTDWEQIASELYSSLSFCYETAELPLDNADEVRSALRMYENARDK